MARNITEKDWRDGIKIGDILLERGIPRAVREVTMNVKTKRLRYVAFSIRRCSWTGRCYTFVDRAALSERGFTASGKRVEKAALIDKLIAHDILYDKKEQQRLTCCDVKGIS